MYSLMRNTPGAVLAEMPYYDTANTVYMYFSTWHWTPMVNGYSGFVPNSYIQLQRDILLFPAAEAVDALRRRGVTQVTVSWGLGDAGCNELMEARRRARRLRLSADTVWRGSPVQLYELL